MDDTAYAARFALEHAHYVRDLGFWRAAAERLGDPVLDVGCASGRVSLALAEAGHRVVALDRSPSMLRELVSRARERGLHERITPVAADMRDFRLSDRFGAVLLPMNTFQLMHSREDQLACLRALHSHLSPGGEVIIEVAHPDFGAIEGSLGALVASGVWHDPESGRTLLHSSRYDTFDRAARRVTFTLRIDERGPDGEPGTALERNFDVRLFTSGEMVQLLESAGLSPIASHGDFDGRPLRTDSEIQIHRAGR